MRAFGRDLIRGGHYGQRSCEPHQKAGHMAAPTNAAYVKKALANPEPSTHGPLRTSRASVIDEVMCARESQNSWKGFVRCLRAVMFSRCFQRLPAGLAFPIWRQRKPTPLVPFA